MSREKKFIVEFATCLPLDARAFLRREQLVVVEVEHVLLLLLARRAGQAVEAAVGRVLQVGQLLLGQAGAPFPPVPVGFGLGRGLGGGGLGLALGALGAALLALLLLEGDARAGGPAAEC